MIVNVLVVNVLVVIGIVVGYVLGNCDASRVWKKAWIEQERKHDAEVRETMTWASKEVIKAEEFFSTKMKELVELKEHLQ